jgi:PAS domain S-box-containing protein/excisionase family DNA binding protein
METIVKQRARLPRVVNQEKEPMDSTPSHSRLVSDVLIIRRRDQPYLSVSEAAKRLGVSRVTIWRWMRAGLLPAVRLGHRTVRLRSEDLESMVAQDNDHDALNSNPVDLAKTWHIVRFYEADQTIADAVGEFIGAALAAGDVGIVIATEAHRAAIEEHLQAAGLDTASARTSGRFTSLNALETLVRIMVDGKPDQCRFNEIVGSLVARATAGGRRVRIFGEMVGLLLEQSNHAGVIRLEELWNELRVEHAFSLLCGYRMPNLSGDSLSPLTGSICAAHDHVVPTEAYLGLTEPGDRLRAVAELEQKARSLAIEVRARQQAEQRLEAALASEQRKQRELSNFVENAPIGLVWIDRDGTIVWANQAELDLLGYAREDFLGRRIAEFNVAADADDDFLARLERSEPLSGYPVRLRCNDGSIKRVLIDSTVVCDDGRPVRTQCFTRDVTELHHAAERTRRLQEITEQLSSSLESNLVLAMIARSAADLLEVPVGAVFLLEGGMASADFVLAAAHGIDEARHHQLRLPRKASLAGRAIDECRTLIVDDARSTSGTALPALLTGETTGSEIAAPIIAGDTRLGVVKAFSPAVRRFNPEDAALLTSLAAAAAIALTNARLYSDAQQGIEARDEFLSMAAHDLKTPLASVKATAQLLRRRLARGEAPNTDRLIAGLASIDDTTSAMAAQLDEFVDNARIQMGGQLELRRHPIDLVPLARRVAAAHQETTQHHTIQVQTSQPELVANVDDVRMGRVLDNLLSNAIKYSPGGGRIDIRLTREGEAGGDAVLLSVEDHGLGIPAADLPRIFEHFRRAANVEGRIGGAGIGLASVRHVVEQHGGTIVVDSVEGVGSTFTVRLPLHFTVSNDDVD